MDQTPNEAPKRGRGGDTRTPQAKQQIAQREEQIVQLRLRRIPFSAIARTVGVNKSNAIRAFNKALRRNTRTIRAWIAQGIIPDAPQRTRGGTHEGGLGATTTAKRLWPAEEINAIIEIAQQEGIIENTRAAWNENNFQQRVWDEITALRKTSP